MNRLSRREDAECRTRQERNLKKQVDSTQKGLAGDGTPTLCQCPVRAVSEMGSCSVINSLLQTPWDHPPTPTPPLRGLGTKYQRKAALKKGEKARIGESWDRQQSWAAAGSLALGRAWEKPTNCGSYCLPVLCPPTTWPSLEVGQGSRLLSSLRVSPPPAKSGYLFLKSHLSLEPAHKNTLGQLEISEKI